MGSIVTDEDEKSDADGKPPTLHRHNTLPSHLELQLPPPSAAMPAEDFEMVSWKPSAYTSLRDLLPYSPSSAASPTASAAASAAACGGGAFHSSGEIPIRNRLVKQAAWAYLQPMSSPDSAVCGGDGDERCSAVFRAIEGCLSPVFAVFDRIFRR
ncbi:hypothetical protein QJS04_geneDACA008579 [Acorus gramineus]|uniref:Uncharacterized protein n=1 Tax=Acorus gramineus TaxID=55184 RepID=A0AAV9AIQ6_ACOGR|nr:hypothetical protein QJS04_geneDACA008579 [Acorus gramineus]